METQMRQSESAEILSDVLRLVSNVRRNSSLKFIEKLFIYISLEAEELNILPIFDDLPFVLPLFNEDTNKAIKLILPTMETDIKMVFKRSGEYIQNKGNLKVFISFLASKLFRGPSHNMLYFFVITSRLFSLLIKTYETIQPDLFIITIVDVLEENESHIKALGGFNALNKLVEDIIKYPRLMYYLPLFNFDDLLNVPNANICLANGKKLKA